jgi:beta-mannosidase
MVPMQRVSLNGSWRVAKAGQRGAALPARVPGCVHTDLLAAGRIPDPYYRDAE